MSEHAPVREVPLDKITRPLPGFLRPLFLASALLGGATFLALALKFDPQRAWRIYHVNWLYWTGIAQAGVLFAAVTTVAKGRWATPLRRMAEASVAFLPVSLVLFGLSWLGKAHIFPWVADPAMLHESTGVKEFWLRPGFLFARDLFAMILLFGASIVFVRNGVRQDVAFMKDRLPPKFKPLYDRLTAGWKGDEDYVRSGELRATLGPVLILLYAVVMSLLAFDLVMSLAPFWVSNLLGGFFFMGAWLAGLMTLALLMLFWRRHFELDDLITPNHLHDVGKMCFAFTIFWAYTFFAQFLVIWYGNLREETHFLYLRLSLPEWRGISTAMVVLCFLLPFWGLISIKAKKTPAVLATFALISLTGLWVDRFVLVVPSIVQRAPNLPLGIAELLITAGFFGLWGLCYLWFAERFPLVSPTLVKYHGERRAHVHASFI